MDFSSIISNIIYLIPALLISLVLHEWAHGYTSYLLGDPNPKHDGRLSLNPLNHIDPVGALCLLVFHFGWAKPVVVNPRAYKNPKMGMALTALAGPLMNFIISFICICIMLLMIKFRVQVSPITSYLYTVTQYTAILSIGLGVFNLIPVPPLDGSKILFSFLPEEMYFHYMKYEKYGMLMLMVLIFTGFLSSGLSNINQDIYVAIYKFATMIIGI